MRTDNAWKRPLPALTTTMDGSDVLKTGFLFLKCEGGVKDGTRTAIRLSVWTPTDLSNPISRQ
jgi:hypothetical protein